MSPQLKLIALDAEALNAAADFAAEVGTRLVASVTITKLREISRNDPQSLDRANRVGLPHDWLNLQLIGELTTDRGEASGSGWWSTITGEQRRDMLALAIGQEKASRIGLPRVIAPGPTGAEISAAKSRDALRRRRPGCGDSDDERPHAPHASAPR